jgi:hypothetical protein
MPNADVQYKWPDSKRSIRILKYSVANLNRSDHITILQKPWRSPVTGIPE